MTKNRKDKPRFNRRKINDGGGSSCTHSDRLFTSLSPKTLSSKAASSGVLAANANFSCDPLSDVTASRDETPIQTLAAQPGNTVSGTNTMVIVTEDADYVNFLETQKAFGDDFVDPIYRTFLEHLRVHGKSYVYEMENEENGLSTIVHYDAEDEDIGNNSSRLSNNMAAKTRLQNNGIFLEPDALAAEEDNINNVTHEDVDDITVFENSHEYCSMELEECSKPDFKSKLMIIQSKPYNQKEFDYLYDKAAERKLLKKQRQLRSCSKFYTTDEVGQSYFDYYPDFEEKFGAADRDMKLNLLRGFFFWMKNVCNEGSFKPWASLPPEVNMSSVIPIYLLDD